MWMVVMNKLYFISFLLFSSILFAENNECQSGQPEVFFVSPENGYVSDTSEIKLVFGIKNFNIAPAGINGCDSGHHHLIIDAELPNLDRPIPSSKNYIHFGKGQTETTIKLQPGKHSLQLLVGNYAHIPHKNPIISEKINIEILSSQ